MLFNRGIVLMRLPINQKNKNRKNYEITCTYDIKFSSQTTVL